MKQVFSVLKEEMTIPIIANIPHASTFIPEDLRKKIILSDEELERQSLMLTDWYVDELFSHVHELGGVSLVYNYSRLVLDPERFEDDEKECMAKKGMGVLYINTVEGDVLRPTPSAKEREELLDRFYRPYHRAFEEEVQHLLTRFDRCLILDCHSFPSVPLPYEEHQDPDRPEICIGTSEFHTPQELIDAVVGFSDDKGWKSELNRPFGGTYVPLEFYKKDRRVHSMMIEVNRGLYMDEDTGLKSPSFDGVRRTLDELIVEIAGAHSSNLGR